MAQAGKTRGTRCVTTTIGSDTYMLNTMPTREGLKVVMAAARFLGSSFDLEVQDFDLAKLALQLDDSTLALAERVLEGLSCNDAEVDFDDHFSGNYGTLIKVLVWACKENFSSFFDGAPVSIQKLATMGAQELKAKASQLTPVNRRRAAQ